MSMDPQNPRVPREPKKIFYRAQIKNKYEYIKIRNHDFSLNFSLYVIYKRKSRFDLYKNLNSR